MKKLLSFLLVFVLVMSMAAPTLAVVPGEDTVAGSDGLVLHDHFSAEHYDISTYMDGDTIYVITVLDDGSVEYVVSGSDGSVLSLWTTVSDLNFQNPSNNHRELINNNQFIHSIIDYGKNHSSLLRNANVSFVSFDDQTQLEPHNYHVDDYNALMAKLQRKHGSQHSDYSWAGFFQTYYEGTWVECKETLTYNMHYRDSIEFKRGATLGNIVALIARFFNPAVSATAAVIAKVLDISADITTELIRDGVIAGYYGSAVYFRYVLINEGGPYYNCSKVYDYEGWAEYGHPGSVVLEQTAITYSHTKAIFESYETQIERAYENYI